MKFKSIFKFPITLLFIFLISIKINAQLQSTWIKTLFYATPGLYPYYHDSTSVGPQGFAVRPDGKFFVLNMDYEQRDQTIYLIDSLGRLIRSIGAGSWFTLQEWDSFGIKSTPDSGCTYIEHYNDFGSWPGANNYTLKKINKNGIVSTIHTWVYPNFVSSAIPNYHQSYYYNLNGFVIDYSTGDTIQSGIISYVFTNDDYLQEGGLFSRTDTSGSLIWSTQSDGYTIIANSETLFYAVKDSLRKYDATNGTLLWTKPKPSEGIACIITTTDGLAFLDGRTITITDSSSNILNQNIINFTHFEPRELASMMDGSLLTGGAFLNYTRWYGNTPSYSSAIIKLNQMGEGTIDSTSFFLNADCDQDGYVIFSDDAVMIAAAFGQSNGITASPDSGFNRTLSTCYSPEWSQSFETGLNYKYSDCNLDGTIDYQDFDALYEPYYFGIHNDSTGIEVRMACNQNALSIGDTVEFYFILGNIGTQIDSIYGLSMNFRIFSNSNLDFIPNKVEIKNNVLGDTASNLFHYVSILWNNNLQGVVLCRTDHQNVSIMGDTLITFRVVLTGNFSTGFGLPIPFVHIISKGGYTIPVQVLIDTLQLTTSIYPIDEKVLVKIYPVPASEKLNISCENNTIDEIIFLDISGKIIYKTTNISSATKIDTGNWPNGIYFADCKIRDSHSFSRIVILH